MTEETFQDHPIQLVSEIGERWPDLTLSFSQYFYRPRSPFDERLLFAQRAADVTVEWLRAQLQKLPQGWDLALNSNVKDSRSREHHLPMIDFAKRAVSAADVIFMRSILGASFCRRLTFFDSGRSLHAYGLQLLGPGEWREFMGRLLLLNPLHEEPLIDTRWVGHRLVSGYSALRWSSNSAHYLRVPVRMRIDLSVPGRDPAGSKDQPSVPSTLS